MTKNFFVKAGVIAAALVVGSALVSCSEQGKDTSSCERVYTIGFSQPTGEASYVNSLKQQVEKAAGRHPCVDLYMDNTQQNDLQSQRDTLESWVLRQVDAIVVLPVDAGALQALRRQQQQQGGRWLTYGGPQPSTDGSVGFNSVESGELVANAAVKWFEETYPNGDATAAVTTLTSLPTLSGRWEGPQRIFNDAGLEVVSTQDCADSTCGLQVAEDALKQHPNLRVFIGFNDDAALGALRAIKNAEIDPNDVFIAGQDGTQEALTAIEAAGAYRATAAISLTDLAGEIIDSAIESIESGRPVDAVVPTELASASDPVRIDELRAAFNE